MPQARTCTGAARVSHTLSNSMDCHGSISHQHPDKLPSPSRMPGVFYRTSQDGQGDVSEVQWVRSQFATFDFLFGVVLGKHRGGGLIPAVPVYTKHIHVRGRGSCRAHSCVTGNQCDK